MTRTLLREPLPIGPDRHPTDQIKDAEAFCRYHMDAAFDTYGHFETPAEYEESLSLLIIELFRIEERFNPERNDCFANYARSILPKRAIDVGPRRICGRNGIRLPERHHAQLDESLREHQPRSTDTPLESDPDPDRGPAPQWLQDQRDRDRTRSHLILGLPTTRRAA